jgi:hypothetical protein
VLHGKEKERSPYPRDERDVASGDDGLNAGGARALLGVSVASAGLICVAPSVAVGGQLPDGRAYEQVTPTEKHGNEAGAERGIPLYTLASPDGNAVFFATTGPLGAAPSGIDLFSVAQRDGDGAWLTRAALPASTDENASFVEARAAGLMPSSDSAKVAYSAVSPFVASNPGGFASIYLAGSDPFVEPIWIGRPTIATPDPAIGEFKEVQGEMALAGAAGDLSSVYFTYFGTLVPEDAGREANVASTDSWGFYEWRNGRLRSAAELPDGSYDPFGAVPAAIGHFGEAAAPRDFDNEVSEGGDRAFFVSPDPAADQREQPESAGEPFPLGRAPELYVRVDGERSVLVSGSATSGLPAPDGPLLVPNVDNAPLETYAVASPDGSHVFFESVDALTADAPSNDEPKEYVFDTRSGNLRYAPGVAEDAEAGAGAQASVQGSSTTGDVALLVKMAGGHFPMEADLWQETPEGGQTIRRIAALPSANGERPVFTAARGTADGSVFVFATNSPIPGFNNAGGFQQVYRYSATASSLTCVSCPPEGTAPSGDALVSHYSEEKKFPRDNRGMSADGAQVYFDTPDALVPQDVNSRRDVYEWENGERRLISTGSDPHDSYFLDNSASGSDVFFATAEGLAIADTDGAYDIYDARIGGSEATGSVGATECVGDECQGPPSAPPALGTPTSATFSGPGNLAPLASKAAVKPKALTNAQKLAKALKACRAKPKRERAVCEAKAHKRYAAKPKHKRKRDPHAGRER